MCGVFLVGCRLADLWLVVLEGKALLGKTKLELSLELFLLVLHLVHVNVLTIVIHHVWRKVNEPLLDVINDVSAVVVELLGVEV